MQTDRRRLVVGAVLVALGLAVALVVAVRSGPVTVGLSGSAGCQVDGCTASDRQSARALLWWVEAAGLAAVAAGAWVVASGRSAVRTRPPGPDGPLRLAVVAGLLAAAVLGAASVAAVFVGLESAHGAVFVLGLGALVLAAGLTRLEDRRGSADPRRAGRVAVLAAVLAGLVGTPLLLLERPAVALGVAVVTVGVVAGAHSVACRPAR